MDKAQYIAEQLALGKTHGQIIDTQPTEQRIGAIRGDNLRHVVDVLAKGLQDRLDAAEPGPTRTALIVVFRYLGMASYEINLAIPENLGLLEKAVAEGLVLPAERDKLLSAATYSEPIYNITRADFVGDWVEFGRTNAQRLRVTLYNDAPEPTTISIESRDILPDDRRGAWRHNSAVTVHGAGVYFVPIRNETGDQEVRWSCAYNLDIEVG